MTRSSQTKISNRFSSGSRSSLPTSDPLGTTLHFTVRGLPRVCAIDRLQPTLLRFRVPARRWSVARKLNPNSAMSYDAEFHLIADDTFGALQVLRRKRQHSIRATGGYRCIFRMRFYLSVDQPKNSVEAAKRGIELEPSTPFTRAQYILALVYSGEFSKAKADIAEARKKWPNDPAIDGADFALQYHYGDPRAGLALLPKIGDYSDADLAPARKVDRSPA